MFYCVLSWKPHNGFMQGMDVIAQNIEYYKQNKKEFTVTYAGRHIVIKNMQVVGDYLTHTQAVTAASELHEAGTFIIERPISLVTK